MGKMTLDEMYAKYAQPADPAPRAPQAASVAPQRAAECKAIDYEMRYAEALQRASDATHERYQRVHAALVEAGATILEPGPLAGRIAATLRQGDELAELLRAEVAWVQAVDACRAFHNIK
jgi:hypothetical protein